MHLWSGFNFAGRLTHMLRFTTLWTLLFLFEIFSLFLTSGYYAKEQLILSMVKVHVCYLNYHFCIAVHYPHSTFFVYFCCLQFKDLSFCCIIPWRLCTLHMQVDNGITSPSAKDAVLLRETGSAVILFAGAVDSWHFVFQGNGHLTSICDSLLVGFFTSIAVSYLQVAKIVYVWCGLNGIVGAARSLSFLCSNYTAR